MQKDAPTPVESFAQTTVLNNDPNNIGSAPSEDPPTVLEAIEDSEVLRDEPVAVLCPGCGTAVSTYETGLPDRVIHFKDACSACEVELRRWSVVAVLAALESYITPDCLAAITQAYWDHHLWAGITTSGNPRNEEYTRLYSKRAAAYDWDWSVTCPLCRRSLDELDANRLDYHHWTRPPAADQGICLCRECHDAINANQCDEQVDWQARKLGLGGQHHLQIARLAARETLVIPYDDLTTLAETIVERYNAPYEPHVVHSILTQAFLDEAVRATLDDASLRAGVIPDA